MKFKTKLFASALMLILPLVLGSAAYAGTSSDKNAGSGKTASYVTSNGSSKNDGGKNNGSKNADNNKGSKNNGKGHDRDDDRDHDDDDHNDHDGNHHDDDDNDDHGNGHGGGGTGGSEQNGKIYVCHATGSGSNPYVLIKVAASAAQTHYNHGDPVQFTNLGHGKCAPVTPPPPTVSLSLAPNPIYVNTGTTTLSWSSTGATSCAAPFGTTSGSLPFGPYTSIGTVPVTVTCTGPGGSTTATAQIDVVAPPPAPTLTLSLSANPIFVNTGTTTLSWSSTGATSCAAPFGTTSGSLAFGPYTAIGTVSVPVTCTGPGGSTTATAQIDVVPQAPLPTVSLTLGANEIHVNTGTTTLSWTSTNATSCSAPGGATSGLITLGTYSVIGPVEVVVTCTGPGGSASATVWINVVDLPDVELLCGMTTVPEPHLVYADYFPGTGVLLMDYADDADLNANLTGNLIDGGDWLIPNKVLVVNNVSSEGSVSGGADTMVFYYGAGIISLTTNARCSDVGLVSR